MPESAGVVVIGAGLAGAATAYHLVRAGVRDVLLLEREAVPGSHSSGRNAAMARQAVLPAAILPLAVESARFLAGTEHETAGPLLRRCGSLILAAGPDADAARASLPAAREAGLTASWLGHDEIVARVPATAGGSFEGGVETAEDGVVDVAALLGFLLQGARRGGARAITGRPVAALEVAGGRVVAVETERGRIATERVVNAAGAWAGEVGSMAGAPLPLRPCRRHLAVSEPLDWVDRDWPFVWDVSAGLYFRPEPPGLLLCPCDEDEHPPGEVPAVPEALETLAAKVARHMPRLSGVQVARVWAGLRTLTPDGSFAIGRDPRVEGLIWCAGLGGHGVTTSAAVGRLAAAAVLGEPSHPEHDPARLIG